MQYDYDIMILKSLYVGRTMVGHPTLNPPSKGLNPVGVTDIKTLAKKF